MASFLDFLDDSPGGEQATVSRAEPSAAAAPALAEEGHGPQAIAAGIGYWRRRKCTRHWRRRQLTPADRTIGVLQKYRKALAAQRHTIKKMAPSLGVRRKHKLVVKKTTTGRGNIA